MDVDMARVLIISGEWTSDLMMNSVGDDVRSKTLPSYKPQVRCRCER